MSSTRVMVVRVFHGALALLLAYVLVQQIRLTHDEGRSLVNTFSYFTIQSNVLILVTSAIVVFVPTVSGNLWRPVRLAALCGITTTGLVYATIIAPYVHLSGDALLYDYVFHYVVPIVSVLGFVFVGPRLPFRTRDLVYLVWPIAWLVYTMVRAEVTNPRFQGFDETPSRYPYRFLDVDQVSTFEVVAAIVVITLVLVGLGSAYIWAEGKLDRREA